MIFFPTIFVSLRQHAVQIHFVRGMLSAHVEGNLNRKNHSENNFSFNVKGGERIIVNLVPLTRGLLLGGTVEYPNQTFDGEHGGLITNQISSKSGTAFVTVNLNNMGTEKKTGRYIIEVIRLPSYITSVN